MSRLARDMSGRFGSDKYGVRSQHSVRSYAYDLLVWVRFLDEACGKIVWEATRIAEEHDCVEVHLAAAAVADLQRHVA